MLALRCALFRRLMFLVLIATGFGCKPKIGDDCTTTTECNISDPQRICLTEAQQGFPGGYCTLFNCAGNDCPSEALCVGYRATLGDSEECATGQSARLRRSYCMLRCNKDADCRGGYKCMDVTEGNNPWGAAVLSTNPGSGKVCALEYTDNKTSEDRESGVCRSEIEEPSASSAVSSAPTQSSSVMGADSSAASSLPSASDSPAGSASAAATSSAALSTPDSGASSADAGN